MWVTLSSNNIRLIARLFREAVDLDPFNVEAWIGLSQTLLVEGLLGKLRVTVAYPAAQAALERALEIDSGRREAKCLVAWYKMLSTRDWQGARQGFEEALMHRPQSSHALVGRALLHVAEECLQDASGVLQEALRQFPFCFPAKAIHCWVEYLRGEHAHVLSQIAEARASGEFGPLFDAVEALASIQIEPSKAHIERLEAMVADSPHHDVLQGALGYAYAAAGQEQRARDILEDLTRFDAHERVNAPYAIAPILIGLNQRQEAVKRLEQAYQEGSFWSLGFRSDPILAPLRNDPHYLLFMSRVSYPAPEDGCPRLGFVG
jgi:tetratricopeptide (TPR) repeat protein